MLRTGKEHTASLRDGRIVYIGGKRVDDVTQHSAFRNAAQNIAASYDRKADPANREVMTTCAHADNLLAYYRYARDNDLYVVYAVLPPQAARNPEFYQRQNIPVPTLRVVREDDS